jgi:hypothetical protein
VQYVFLRCNTIGRVSKNGTSTEEEIVSDSKGGATMGTVSGYDPQINPDRRPEIHHDWRKTVRASGRNRESRNDWCRHPKEKYLR